MSDLITDSTVVSTRIRLARNVRGYPFPNMLKDKARARELANIIYTCLKPLNEGFELYYMDNISDVFAKSLKENYLVSKALLDNREYSYCIKNPDGNLSVMINEEDHIRMQCISKGFCLEKVYELILGVESCIGEKVVFSKNGRFGFLTACPTNLGTGMRASVMLFLPAITKNGCVEETANSIIPLGLTLRGVYGEGSGAEGYLYQLSNEVTMGMCESDLIMKVKDATTLITKLEAKERLEIRDNDVVSLKDSCGRAYGILSNAEILSYEEFLRLVSEVKLGAALELYSMDFDRINELIVAMRPSNVSVQNVSDVERDIFRARCVRQAMQEFVVKRQ